MADIKYLDASLYVRLLWRLISDYFCAVSFQEIIILCLKCDYYLLYSLVFSNIEFVFSLPGSVIIQFSAD